MSGGGVTRSCVLAALVVGLVGCSGERAGLRPPPRAGADLPELTGPTLAGDSLALSDLRGEAVLVNLWATWCPPCREETPYLQSLHERFGPRGLRTVGISVDDPGTRDLVTAFARMAGVTYDILLDPRGRSMDLFQVIGLPATFLVDTAGVIRLARIGPVSESDTTFVQALEAIVPR